MAPVFLLALPGAGRLARHSTYAPSLTRDVSLGLGWIIEPIIQKLAKESLINTLEATRHTRQALLAEER